VATKQTTPKKTDRSLLVIGGVVAAAAVAAILLVASGSNQPPTASELAAQANQDFLAGISAQDGVVTTESGLRYQVITQGDGAMPTADDSVTVHYVGTLTNGTEFDSSFSRNEPATFPLNGVIAGWTEGVQLMPVGSTYRFWIPPELGYGSRGAGGVIPPNAVLQFDVTLISINE
jgi:FKBP-type peptidyl-prolyl cis-trans isomerase